MATYNGQRFLAEQLHSLRVQTVVPLELVVCDDGSVDETEAVVTEFAASAPFPVRFHRNNERLGPALNFLEAATLCKGEYIAWCDQDDVWLPAKLERCMSLLKDKSVALLCHNSRVVDSTLRTSGFTFPGFRKTTRSAPYRGNPWFVPPAHALIFHSSLANLCYDIKKKIAQKNDLFGEPSHDQLVYLIANTACHILSVPDVLVKYRRHENNVTQLHYNSETSNDFSYRYSDHESVLRMIGLWLAISDALADMAHNMFQDQQVELMHASRYYTRLAHYSKMRDEAHMATSQAQRVFSLVNLILCRTYFGRRERYFSMKGLLKDAYSMPLTQPPIPRSQGQ